MTIIDELIKGLKDLPDEEIDDLFAKHLSNRQAIVLRLKFRDSLQPSEIGERFGIHRERVIQITNKAISKLTAPLAWREARINPSSDHEPTELIGVPPGSLFRFVVAIHKESKLEDVYEMVSVFGSGLYVNRCTQRRHIVKIQNFRNSEGFNRITFPVYKVGFNYQNEEHNQGWGCKINVPPSFVEEPIRNLGLRCQFSNKLIELGFATIGKLNGHYLSEFALAYDTPRYQMNTLKKAVERFCIGNEAIAP